MTQIVDINELDDVITVKFMKPRAFNKDYFGGKTQRKKAPIYPFQIRKRKVLNRSEAQFREQKNGAIQNDGMVGSFIKKRTGL